MNTTPTSTPTSTSIPLTGNVALVHEVLAAYDQAVNNLKNCPPSELAEARNDLEWGWLNGSKVLGVRSTAAASELLRRVILNGTKRDIQTDQAGNTVMCFELTYHYKGKGYSPLVRMYDWCSDKSHRALVGIGVDFNDKTDETYLRLSAPDVDELKMPRSNFITVILGPNREFVGWYCGEPIQVYTPENLAVELLDSQGRICLDNLQIEVGLDYNRRTEKRRFHFNKNKHQKNIKPGVNNLGLTAALNADTRDIMEHLHNPGLEEEVESLPASPAQD